MNCTIALSFIALIFLHSFSPAWAQARETAQPANQQMREATVRGEHKEKATTYRRVEFLIVGTDCPVCLGRIASKMKKVAGVKKATVWQFPPSHYGVVIYDAQRANWDKIVQATAGERISFQDIKDVAITMEDARHAFIDSKDLK